jgi:rhodanese-related sulfurtransferase
MLRQFFSVLTCLVMGGRTDSAQQHEAVSPQQFQQLLEGQSQLQLIDVRTPQEYEAGHLAEAQLITLQRKDFQQQIRQLDVNQPIFVYCRSGRRSNLAASQLAEVGFVQVYDLQGGLAAWSRSGLPLAQD